jgi:tRNA threonylcarbamoyladenosine biosynthesis protein TsaE
MTLQSYRISISNSEEMENLGRILYQSLGQDPRRGMVVYLNGDLGAGKTTLVRGFLRGMQFAGIVKSPTYTLVEPYEFEHERVFHFDFYRVQTPAELELMGIRDYFTGTSYCLIEWPEKAVGCLMAADLNIQIDIAASSRNVLIEAYSDRGKDVLQALKISK